MSSTPKIDPERHTAANVEISQMKLVLFCSKYTQLILFQINNLENPILQKKREPTILENSRFGFIETVHVYGDSCNLP